MVFSTPALAAAPYPATAAPRFGASISKLTGSGPTWVTIWASPTKSTLRPRSADPSEVTGTRARIVPIFRSV